MAYTLCYAVCTTKTNETGRLERRRFSAGRAAAAYIYICSEALRRCESVGWVLSVSFCFCFVCVVWWLVL